MHSRKKEERERQRERKREIVSRAWLGHASPMLSLAYPSSALRTRSLP